MARTMAKPDPRWKDDPRWNNPSHLRACAEESHFESQRKAFYLPLYVHPDIHNEFPHLSLSNRRDFCWKDCVIYGNAGLTAKDHHALFDEVYREWFPHRAYDKDLSNGSFFGKFVRFTPAGVELEQIIHFHYALCEKLSSTMPEIEDLEPAIPHAVPPQEETRREGAYKLRETIFNVFLVIDGGWQEHGVQVVWKNDEVAKRHNCSEGGDIKGYNSSDAGDLRGAAVFRCSLKRAMQMVVSQDPARAQKRTEYNEMLEETLGDQEQE